MSATGSTVEKARVDDDADRPETVSDGRILGAARRLRALSYGLEAVLYFAIAGSALAIGSVHPWAYVPLWQCAGLVFVLAVARAAQLRALRAQLGPYRFAFQARGRQLVRDPHHYEAQGWECDLSRPVWPHPALFWPGVAFLAWALLQVVPLPESIVHTLSPGRGHLSMAEVNAFHPLSLDAAASLRGIAFALSMLVFYVAGATLAVDFAARRRFRLFVAWFGVALALIALVQVAVRADRIYGFFEPLETNVFFGVFVNRNHFAAYMTMCAMAALAILYRAFERFRYHLGGRPTVRRQIVALGEREGFALILAAVPALFTMAALIATTSRGGILSFVGALGLASVVLGRNRRRLAAVIAALLVALPLAWFGLARLGDRFGQIASDEAGRTAVWRHSLASMSGTWLTGAGLDTFGDAITRVPPLALPLGAASWPEEIAAAIPAHLRIARRTPTGLKGWEWYREAHNDYIQLAVEMGAIGVAILVWSLVMLATRMREPWLAAGVVGILAHATVDFSLQIPAVAVLFFVISAYAERTSSGRAAASRGAERPRSPAAPRTDRLPIPAAASRSRSSARGRGRG